MEYAHEAINFIVQRCAHYRQPATSNKQLAPAPVAVLHAGLHYLVRLAGAPICTPEEPIIFSTAQGLTVSDSIIIQQPAHAAQQLMVLHHGVGASAQHLNPLGQHLAALFPNAFIVSVHAPYAADTATGAQWFSVQDITEENRPARVAEAMPAFIHNLRHWQQTSGVSASATAIVGFSQGAIMALEAAQAQAGLAARIVALSGRYAQLPTHAPEKTTLHFIHGKSDPVIHYGYCVSAAER